MSEKRKSAPISEIPQKEGEVGIVVGHVAKLFRYPVKSMMGETVSQLDLGYTNLVGDRSYAFVQADSKSAFPWLTARNFPKLILYKPRFTDTENVKKSQIVVDTPDGQSLPLESPELKQQLEEKTGRRVNLLRLGRGTYDAMPVSLISTKSIDQVSEAVGKSLDVRRFRPNILVEMVDGIGDFDSTVLEAILVFGNRPDSAQVAISLKDPRCKIPNIDPNTGEIDKSILRVLEENFSNLLGVYGSTYKPGSIKKGDSIRIIPSKK